MAVRWQVWDREQKCQVTKTDHVGLVVDDWSRYLGDLDTIYGVVFFDPHTGEFKEEGGGYVPPSFEVDAPEDVLEAYAAEKAAKVAAGKAARLKYEASKRLLEVENEKWTPRPGKPLVVVKGRKIPVGTKVECEWYGETQYGYRARVTLPSGESVWTSADNVEVDGEAMGLVAA